MHFSQKALSLVVFLMLVVSSAAQAKRVVERPYFFASNNHKLEIERVTLDKKATVLDVKSIRPVARLVSIPMPFLQPMVRRMLIWVVRSCQKVFLWKCLSVGTFLLLCVLSQCQRPRRSLISVKYPTTLVGTFTECASTADGRRMTFRSICYSKHLTKGRIAIYRSQPWQDCCECALGRV